MHNSPNCGNLLRRHLTGPNHQRPMPPGGQQHPHPLRNPPNARPRRQSGTSFLNTYFAGTGKAYAPYCSLRPHVGQQARKNQHDEPPHLPQTGIPAGLSTPIPLRSARPYIRHRRNRTYAGSQSHQGRSIRIGLPRWHHPQG